MRAHTSVRTTTELQRKHPSLPVYVIVPGKRISSWNLAGTTVIEGTANGHDFGRRNIKAWGKGSDDWFIEFTAPFCAKAGLSVGDEVRLVFTPADMSPPQELQLLLSRRKSLGKAWAALTDSQRRDASEYVRAAKGEQTRQRRAQKVVGNLE